MVKRKCVTNALRKELQGKLGELLRGDSSEVPKFLEQAAERISSSRRAPTSVFKPVYQMLRYYDSAKISELKEIVDVKTKGMSELERQRLIDSLSKDLPRYAPKFLEKVVDQLLAVDRKDDAQRIRWSVVTCKIKGEGSRYPVQVSYGRHYSVARCTECGSTSPDECECGQFQDD